MDTSFYDSYKVPRMMWINIEISYHSPLISKSKIDPYLLIDSNCCPCFNCYNYDVSTVEN